MYEYTTKLRIPKYLILSTNENGAKSTVTYAETIDEVIEKISKNAIHTIYVRNSSASQHWIYFCDISKEVLNK